jgi:hypothetical protein
MVPNPTGLMAILLSDGSRSLQKSWSGLARTAQKTSLPIVLSLSDMSWCVVCLEMARVHPPLARNARLFWLRYSGFQPLCHNIKLNIPTEYRDLAVGTCTERAGSRFQISARRSAILRGLCGSPQSSRQIPRYNLKLGHKLFYPHYFQFLIN